MSLISYYCDCNFTAEQLHGKLVEFRLVIDGIGHKGNSGKFIVSKNPEGKLWIRIDTPLPREMWQPQYDARHRIFSLPCDLVRWIRVHPEGQENPDGPQFQLLELPDSSVLSA